MGPNVSEVALRLGVKPTVRIGVRIVFSELAEFTKWIKESHRTGHLSIEYSQGKATWINWEESS